MHDVVLDPPPPTRERPRRGPLAARIALALLAFLVVVILGVALLPSSFWRWLIVHEVSAQTGRTATIDGQVKVRLFSRYPEVLVEGFSLSDAPWTHSPQMLSVQRFDARVSLFSLLRFKPVFPSIAIDSPRINLERDSSGRANWDFSTAGKQKPATSASKPLHIPVIQQLTLTNGTVKANDRVRKLTFDGKLSVEEKQNTPDDHALRVQGTGALNNKPFTLDLHGDPLIGIQPSTPYAFAASITAADIKFNAHVAIPHPFDMAALQADFKVSGSDLADIYYLTGLALPNTPPYEVSGTIVRDNLNFRIDDFRGKLGSSDIAGKLSIDTSGERPKLGAVLTSKQLNIADLAAPLGTQATPERKSDTLAKPAAAAPAPAPTLLLPDADLQVQRVRAMDADVAFDAASVVMPKLPMKKVRFHLLLVNGKLTLDPLTFTLPEGQFSGTVAIDARGATPQTDIDMKLSNVDMAQFKPKDSNTPPFEGTLLGRIKLHGAGASVHKAAADAEGDITIVIPQGEMRDSLAELTGINLSRGLGLLLTKNEKDTQVRCGVLNLKADGGELKASTLLLDTTHVLVTGGGDINLQTEAIDMHLGGKPKQVRLLRLRTPIELKGTLLHPKIGVDPGKVALQAGGAAALGVLLTPVAAVLAFVDGGLAKDANCAALLSQAEAGKGIPQQ